MSWASEKAAHCGCAAVFFIILIPFGLHYQHLDVALNDASLAQSAVLASGNASSADLAAAQSAADAASKSANMVLGTLTQAWLGFFALALALWVYMRFGVVRSLEREWGDAHATAAEDWARNHWHEADRPVVAMKQRLLALQRQAFREVVAPLEPYVFVFLLFLPPAIVLATDWCSDHSTNYVTCEAPCELALAFRSIGSSLVYLTRPGSWEQLKDWRRLFSKAAARFRAQVRCTSERRAGDSANRVLFADDANEVRHFEGDSGASDTDAGRRG